MGTNADAQTTPSQTTPTGSGPQAEVGTELELTIDNIAHGGIFVARHEGRVVFVSDTLPGERVRARLTEANQKSFWRAETVSVLEQSPERQPHIWAAAALDRDPVDRAGGAEFGHIALSHQRELKRQVLADALHRMAKVDTDVTVEAVPVGPDSSPGDAMDGTGWRTRVSLHVDTDGTVGPYAARSHRVIPIADLPLAQRGIEAAAPLDRLFRGAAAVDLVAPSVGDVRVTVVTTDSRGKRAQTPRHVIREVVADREFQLDAAGFWQVHARAAETLFTAVQDMIDPERFEPKAANLDLYGGVGLLAAAVGDRFGKSVRITSVESDPEAVNFAATNLAEWVGATAETDRVERFLQRLKREADAAERARQTAATVILDPPRSGAGKAVVDQLAFLEPAQIIYVACDPVALARDVALFAGHGYELKTLRAFDLFPNTHHVEAVALLSR